MTYRPLATLTLLALSVALVPVALASTTWYVNGMNGSDSNNCLSSEFACKTVGHAISLTSSGDSITIAAATYSENLTIRFSLNLIGAGASTTIIDGGGVGGVIAVTSGNVTLSGLTIRNGAVVGNYYGGAGAGIFNSGTLTVIASTITGNLASAVCPPTFGCGAFGGGIYNSGRLTISNTTVAGNTVQAGFTYSTFKYVAYADGGGIFNQGTIIVSNSTLVANTARHVSLGFVFSRGGGISSRGPATISNSTLSGNNAMQGGGIFNYQGYSAAFQNSIVANSSSGGNCAGAMTSKGYNLSSDGSCNFNGPGDMNGTNPDLGPLEYNGGPTQTMALLPGSLAIDGGNPAGCTDGLGHVLKTDQRAMPRPDSEDDAGCDIGAYERQSD